MKNIFFKTIMLKGEAGGTISRIEKTATSGIVDTYTIYLNDGTSTTFEVTNGSSIASIEKTATSGLQDTYTITLTNGETSTFVVMNGEDAPSYEVPTGSVLYNDSAETPEGYEATTAPVVVEAKSASFEAPVGRNSIVINIAKEGYTPIGIVGITGSNTSIFTYSDFYVESATTAKVYYNNTYTSSYDATLELRVLYIKN